MIIDLVYSLAFAKQGETFLFTVQTMVILEDLPFANLSILWFLFGLNISRVHLQCMYIIIKYSEKVPHTAHTTYVHVLCIARLGKLLHNIF